MTQPLVSVIVPVYQVEAYLDQCVESLRFQTYRNLEILLVDDGSPDRCGELCEAYAKEDSRIVVLHKENSGLSDARNLGLSVARGEYIAFVDSDDWVSEHYIANLYHALEETGADLAMSWFESVLDGDEARTVPSDQLLGLTVLDQKRTFERLLYMDGIDTSAWTRLYRKDLIAGLEFPSGKLYEDIPFAMEVFDRCSRSVVIANADYYYRQRAASIQHQVFNPRKMDLMRHMHQLEEYIQSKYPELEKAMSCRLFSAASNMIFQIPSPEENPEEFRTLWSVIKEKRWTIILDKKARKKARLGAILSLFGYKTMRRVYTRTQMRGKQ